MHIAKILGDTALVALAGRAFTVKRRLVMALVATAGLSGAAVAAPEPERVRGTVSAISGDVLTVDTATGGVSMAVGSDTRYVKVVRSDLDHIQTGSFIGTATKNVGDKLVALEVVVFPPSMKGTGEGHYGWDRLPDTTLSGGARTSSSTMTNGSVAAVTEGAFVNSTMTNGSVVSTSAKGGARQLTVTYKGGKQTILVPPTAPIVAFQPDTMSGLHAGATVFVKATKNVGKTTADLVAVGSGDIKPPM